MTQDRNWAEHDRQIREQPTLFQCEMTGLAHKAYGWSCAPWGHWTQEQKDAYKKGYDHG